MAGPLGMHMPDDATPARGERSFVTAGYKAGFALVLSLFFLWAIANNFNDILIRHFQKALDINRAQAGLVQFVFYLGYFLMALPAGLLTRRFGYRAGIIAGLLLYAAGALLFYPAAEMRVYAWFLFALFVLASGAAFLETAANPYVIAFGDPARAAQRINLAQAFNGLGATMAPALGGLFIFSGVEYSAAEQAAMPAAQREAWRASEALMVQTPYLVLAAIVLILTVVTLLVRLPKAHQPARSEDVRPPLRSPALIGAVIAQFFYVGAQVGVWSFFVDFVKDVSPLTSERTAAFGLSISLLLFMLGRFAGAAAMQRIRPGSLLLICAAANIILCLLALSIPGTGAIIALGSTSFFMSIMFPTIFSFGLRDLKSGAEIGSSFIIMAIIGGAIFPPLMGLVAETTGSLRVAMLLPALCFAVVLAYARWVARAESRTAIA